MRIRRRLRRTTKQYIIVSLICIVVIGGAAILTTVLFAGQIREEYKTQLDKAYKELEANQREVYVATADISQGDYISEDKLEKMLVYSSQPEESFITEDNIGQMALIDIPAGTQLLKSMLAENPVTSELREVEYNVININSNIVEKDTVDIRICYPNGESYIVLSKKVLKGYIPETATCHLWINEEEHLRMSAAIVDAGLYKGSYLYVTKYIEPNIQEASIVNYTPSLAILTLLETDPNILERAAQELNRQVRKQLENRLAMSMDLDVSKINWNISPNTSLDLELTRNIKEAQEDGRSVRTDNGGMTDRKFSNTAPADKFTYFVEEEKARESDIEYGE